MNGPRLRKLTHCRVPYDVQSLAGSAPFSVLGCHPSDCRPERDFVTHETRNHGFHECFLVDPIFVHSEPCNLHQDVQQGELAAAVPLAKGMDRIDFSNIVRCARGKVFHTMDVGQVVLIPKITKKMRCISASMYSG